MRKRYKKKTVIFAGGGTGGHIYPALSIAQALKTLNEDIEIVFVGSKIGLESKNFIFGNNDFSGHLVYDEEFMSVCKGKVGIKDEKLIKIRLYFHLFRDALTNSVMVYLTDSMEK